MRVLNGADVGGALRTALGVAVLGAVVFGPPAAAVYAVGSALLAGEPLVYEKTVETTTHAGPLADAAGYLPVWLIIMLMVWGAATGAFPRRI